MSRYECAPCGPSGAVVWDHVRRRNVGHFRDAQEAQGVADRLNRRETEDNEACVGYESALPWMLKPQAW